MGKHYKQTSMVEELLLDPKMRCYCGYKAETMAFTKAKYRRRERAALKRNLAAEVEVELVEMAEAEAEAAKKAAYEAYKTESISYWLDESIDAMTDIECLKHELEKAEERLYEAELMLSYLEEEE